MRYLRGAQNARAAKGNETRAQYYHMQFLKKHLDAGAALPLAMLHQQFESMPPEHALECRLRSALLD